MKPIIKLITHPFAWELTIARQDEANITKQPLTENPYWFENTETKQLYYNIFACLGWPTEITDRETGLPGYAAIVGVIRPSDSLKYTDPINAKFQLLAETSSSDINTLLDNCIDMRTKYGYGCQESLLKGWLGDPERFLTSLALYNEKLSRKYDTENKAILLSPPFDLYSKDIFDQYVRSLRSCLMPEKTRFFFGGCDILRNRLREFRRDDPCVMAVGGLVHTLLSTCLWMGDLSAGMFNVEE